jgi:hypothetical protein
MIASIVAKLAIVGVATAMLVRRTGESMFEADTVKT